jgi:hypothetical protein
MSGWGGGKLCPLDVGDCLSFWAANVAPRLPEGKGGFYQECILLWPPAITETNTNSAVVTTGPRWQSAGVAEYAQLAAFG